MTGWLVVFGYLFLIGFTYPLALRRSEKDCALCAKDGRTRGKSAHGDHVIWSGLSAVFWWVSVPIFIGTTLGRKSDAVLSREAKAERELRAARHDREIARIRREEAEETIRELEAVRRDDERSRQ